MSQEVTTVQAELSYPPHPRVPPPRPALGSPVDNSGCTGKAGARE